MQRRKITQFEKDVEKARQHEDWNDFEELASRVPQVYGNTRPGLSNILLSEASIEQRVYDKAANYIKTALKKEPDNKEALLLKARLQYETQKYEKCSETLEGLDENSLPVRALAGRCKEAYGDLAGAKELFNDILETLSSNGERFKHLDTPGKRRIVGQAIIRLPHIAYENGKIIESIQLLRSFFRIKLNDAFSYREGLRALIHILTRNVTEQIYQKLQVESTDGHVSFQAEIEEALMAYFLWQSTLYQPSKTYYDVILFNDISSILARYNLFSQYSEILQFGLRALGQDATIWSQYALALASAGQISRALTAFKTCLLWYPENPNFLMLTAELYLSRLDDPHEAVKYASQASKHAGVIFEASARHVLGIAHAQVARKSQSWVEREQHFRSAVKELLTAYNISPNDYRVCFNLALTYGELRELDQGLDWVGRCLRLDKNCMSAWTLLTILLSAKKELTQALKVYRTVTKNHPSIESLFLVGRIEEQLHNMKQARVLYQNAATKLINYFKKSREEKEREEQDDDKSSINDRNSTDSDNAPNFGMPTDEGVLGNIANLARLVIAGLRRTGSDYHYRLIEIAKSALPQCNAIFKAELGAFREKDHHTKATNAYENALGVDRNCHLAHLHLGITYRDSGNIAAARDHLQSALRIDPISHETWYYLGLVFKSLNSPEQSAECFQTALKLENTAPVVSFKHFRFIV
eukprot:gb/GECH01000711.1/.p1 GENE.gb/GECH01000711.1/~~gb/GECH01000711.1/.p1  ORF type:complete len:700 (+),score=154.04 gb/GECH01000711.1/:1-2100(+)